MRVAAGMGIPASMGARVTAGEIVAEEEQRSGPSIDSSGRRGREEEERALVLLLLPPVTIFTAGMVIL